MSTTSRIVGSGVTTATPVTVTGSNRARANAATTTLSAKDGSFSGSASYLRRIKKVANGANHGVAAVCEVHVFPADKIPTFHGYQTGKVMDTTVPLPPSGGSLDLAIILTVSAHNGKDKVENWALNNTYNVDVSFVPQGSSASRSIYSSYNFGPGPGSTGSSYEAVMTKFKYNGQVKMLPLAVVKKVSIDHPEAGVYTVSGGPVSSAGYGGYLEGRVTRITVK